MANSLELENAAQLAFWANKPTAYLYSNATQSIPNSTSTPIALQVAQWDNWSGWSSGSNTRYTVQVAGVYQVSGFVAWGQNATGTRIGFIAYNGSEITGSQNELSAYSSSDFHTSVVAPVLQSATVGSYFQLEGFQTSGGNLSTAMSGGLVCSMTVQFVRFP